MKGVAIRTAEAEPSWPPWLHPVDKGKVPSLVLKASERFKHPTWALEGKCSSGMKMRRRGLIGGRKGGRGNRICREGSCWRSKRRDWTKGCCYQSSWPYPVQTEEQTSTAVDRLGFETALPLGNKEYRKNRSLEQGRQPVSLGHLNLRAQKDVYVEVSDKQPDMQGWGLRDSGGGPTVS